MFVIIFSWQSLSAEGHHEHMKRVVYRAVLETLLVETGLILYSVLMSMY